MQQTVSVQTARLLASTLARREGTPLPVMLERLSLDPAHVLQPDATLPKSKMDRVWDRALQISGDEGLGLSLASGLEPGTLGALGYLVQNMPTVGEAFDQLVRYQNLLQQNASVWTVETTATHRTFRFTLLPPIAAVHRHITELAFAALVTLGRAAATEPFTPTAILFRHERALPETRYAKALGIVPRFEQPENEICLSTEACTTRIAGAEPRLAQIVGFYAQHQAQQRESGGLIDAARRALMESMTRGDVSAPTIARVLGMSERTLRRRLTAEGVGFQSVVDDVRFEAAKGYLDQPALSIAEIALLLGFSDARAFTRAFKRWSGGTVSEYRRAQSSR